MCVVLHVYTVSGMDLTKLKLMLGMALMLLWMMAGAMGAWA